MSVTKYADPFILDIFSDTDMDPLCELSSLICISLPLNVLLSIFSENTTITTTGASPNIGFVALCDLIRGGTPSKVIVDGFDARLTLPCVSDTTPAGMTAVTVVFAKCSLVVPAYVTLNWYILLLSSTLESLVTRTLSAPSPVMVISAESSSDVAILAGSTDMPNTTVNVTVV